MANSSLQVQEHHGALVVDSRMIAEDLGVRHRNLMETIIKYQTEIEQAFGTVPFETEGSNGLPGYARFALLTEDQATFVATLSRNTERVVLFKIKLVKAFSTAKALFQSKSSLLPQQLPPSFADVAALHGSIEAMESAGDIQLAQLTKLYMANELLRVTQNSPLLPGDAPMQLEGVVDVAIRLGLRVNKSQESQLGKFVKQSCGSLLQGKNQRYSQASAKQISANMYPANHPDVEAAVRAFFS